MKKNKVILLASIAVAIFVFVVLGVYLKRQEASMQNAEPKMDQSLLVRSHSPIKGSENAPITIVEFLDPECEACRAMHPIVKTILKEYEGRVKLVIRYMPFHGNSDLAASALEEAREAGKFEEALDLFFEKQPEWADHHNPRPELLYTYLATLGLSKEKLNEEYLLSKHKWKVDQDYADGQSIGVRATPTFFVNGQILHEIGYEPLVEAIKNAQTLETN